MEGLLGKTEMTIELIFENQTQFFINWLILNIPGLDVTAPEKRGWVIDPLDTLSQTPIPLWLPFASFIPALLLYLLLFIETNICQLLLNEKTGQSKGSGLHLDIVILCALNCVAAFFGGPWICAATVRSVAHWSEPNH